MEKHLLLISTGGTIASVQTRQGLSPCPDDELLHAACRCPPDCSLTLKQLFALDSSNIQPEEWLQLAEFIASQSGRYDGIVVTHGTDTMAYTAGILSFMLCGIQIPVVLTGSQIPLGQPFSDAPMNLQCALYAAASSIRGVFLAFAGKLILGCRAVKTRTCGMNAFESINYPLIGQVSLHGLDIYEHTLPAAVRQSFRIRVSDRVFLLKLTPGLDPAILDSVVALGYRAVVIEAFGIGGVHFLHRNFCRKIAQLSACGIVIVITSQCLYETSDLTQYEVGRAALAAGAVSAGDMTSEAAFTKLMWLLAQYHDRDELIYRFTTQLCGEITPPIKPLNGEKTVP